MKYLNFLGLLAFFYSCNELNVEQKKCDYKNMIGRFFRANQAVRKVLSENEKIKPLSQEIDKFKYEIQNSKNLINTFLRDLLVYKTDLENGQTKLSLTQQTHLKALGSTNEIKDIKSILYKVGGGSIGIKDTLSFFASYNLDNPSIIYDNSKKSSGKSYEETFFNLKFQLHEVLKTLKNLGFPDDLITQANHLQEKISRIYILRRWINNVFIVQDINSILFSLHELEKIKNKKEEKGKDSNLVENIGSYISNVQKATLSIIQETLKYELGYEGDDKPLTKAIANNPNNVKDFYKAMENKLESAIAILNTEAICSDNNIPKEIFNLSNKINYDLKHKLQRRYKYRLPYLAGNEASYKEEILLDLGYLNPSKYLSHYSNFGFTLPQLQFVIIPEEGNCPVARPSSSGAISSNLPPSYNQTMGKQ